MAAVLALAALLALGKCRRSKSQSGEEMHVHERFFRNVFNGTYVEIGAFDGVTASNTLFLATCAGWRGTLIEGSRFNAQQLERNVARMRTGAEAIFGAVCAPPRTTVRFVQKFTVGGDIEHMADSFARKWHTGDGGAEPASKKPRYHAENRSWTGNVFDVPCRPMQAYVSRYRTIDFFSLDVEGAELEALLTLDLSVTAVTVFLIELEAFAPEKSYKVRTLMRSLGYAECVGTDGWDPPSGLFVHRAQGAQYVPACLDAEWRAHAQPPLPPRPPTLRRPPGGGSAGAGSGRRASGRRRRLALAPPNAG